MFSVRYPGVILFGCVENQVGVSTKGEALFYFILFNMCVFPFLLAVYHCRSSIVIHTPTHYQYTPTTIMR